MARINNLENFVTDVATAIKAKLGLSTTITPANFDTLITSIETGIDTSDANMVAADLALGKTGYARGEKITGTYTPQNQQKNVEYTTNGVRTITADQGYTGLSQVNVDVDIPLHRYDTVVEMNADINNVKQGDTGIVYWEGEGHPNKTSTFSHYWLKMNYVLSREILEDENISCYWSAPSDSWWNYGLRVTITRTEIDVHYSDNSSSRSVKWSSVDGINYARSYIYNESDMDKDLFPNVFSLASEYGGTPTWEPLCAEVLFCTAYDFEGLFTVKPIEGTEHIRLPLLEDAVYTRLDTRNVVKYPLCNPKNYVVMDTNFVNAIKNSVGNLGEYEFRFGLFLR